VRPERVLVACEFGGAVRDAFTAAGHYAMSCDLLPSETPGPHFQGDVLQLLEREGPMGGWDLMIAHPPCTYLAVSGARWFKDRRKEQEEALEFVQRLMDAPIPRICIENPISVISTRIRKPDQIIHPWQFWSGPPGQGEVKKTCLWLKGLPNLVPTTPLETGRVARVWKMGPSPTRGLERSRTHPGIAQSMAQQWSCPIGGTRD
jgi:hypothetical protein